MRKVELLAPGGDVRSVKAAVLAGADAVYLGVGDFNARKRAVNISLADLEELCLIARQRNCRIYLTYNVLALEREVPDLIEFLKMTVKAGIDAVIIQDYGLLDVIRTVLPDLEIHGSTQMTTHNRGQIEFLARLGAEQVNLSRELALEEIRTLSDTARREGLKTEVFVHGAYCVSFSGQCYLSGVLYENSANRGACVQPCRREYNPYPGGNSSPIRPMNLKDNSLYSSAEELISAGADSLKIEGRIKGFEYVYTVVKAWREQLDLMGRGMSPRSGDHRLNGVFNRSFSDNLFKGRLGRDSFTKEPGDQSSRLTATVDGYNSSRKEIFFSHPSELSAGQSITIRSSANEGQGSFICTGTLTEKRGDTRFGFRIDHKLNGRILKGQQVWAQPRFFDFERIGEQLDSISGSRDKIPLDFKLKGGEGTVLELTASAGGLVISSVTDTPLEKAEKNPTSRENITERLTKLGNTPFFMDSCDLSELRDGLFIPMKHLNELRQEIVAQFESENNRQNPPIPIPELSSGALPSERRLAVAVSSREDLMQVPEECARLFQLPSDPDRLEEAKSLFEEFPDLIPWFPSILIGSQFEAAAGFLKQFNPESIVTDNTGIAHAARESGIPWIAGALLNGTNGFALNLFKKEGASGAFVSTELNSRQYRDLTVPEGIQLWAPLAAPTLLMKSRHCLVRNCTDCRMDVMSSLCLRDCEKSTDIVDSQENTVLVLKSRGDYNALYSSRIRLFKKHLTDERVGVLLLDFRINHDRLRPVCSLREYIDAADLILKRKTDAEDLLESLLNTADRSDSRGLDSLQE